MRNRYGAAGLMLALVLSLTTWTSRAAETGGVAYYAEGWDWYQGLCLYHETTWGDSVGCVPADYWCVKPGYIPGEWLTVSANGRSIDCEIGDTVKTEDQPDWLSKYVIELSWDAYLALGQPATASVGEVQPAATAPEPPTAPTRECFDATGHCLQFGFLAYWEQQGGLRTFGLPLTGEFRATDTGLVTQVLERAVLEWQPADGDWAIRGRFVAADPHTYTPAAAWEREVP